MQVCAGRQAPKHKAVQAAQMPIAGTTIRGGSDYMMSALSSGNVCLLSVEHSDRRLEVSRLVVSTTHLTTR